MFERTKLFGLPVILLLIYGNLECESANAGAFFEDLTVEYINELYVDVETFDVSMDYKRDGKNAVKYHADLIQDPPKDLRMKCAASARIFGNYVPTGLSVDGELCQNTRPMKEYIERLLQPLGFNCPIKKGSYHHDGYIPDLSGLPINLISGTHLLFDILLYSPDGTEVMILKAYIVL